MDAALRFSLHLRRRPKHEAPRCPCCHSRMLARSSTRRVTYYYPRCNCPAAEPTKLRRLIDASNVPATAVA